MLSAINLTNKRNAQSKTLSGGMKRKLSVGIALIAGSKVCSVFEGNSRIDSTYMYVNLILVFKIMILTCIGYKLLQQHFFV